MRTNSELVVEDQDAVSVDPESKLGTNLETADPNSDVFIGSDNLATFDFGNDTESVFDKSFILIAQTGDNYEEMSKQMLNLNKLLNIPIDMMGRSYIANKNLIAVPENDPDDFFAGKYFPRRYPSENLSLEYLRYYKKGAGNKTIALVVGIYTSRDKAENALSKIQGKAFILESDVYLANN